MTEQALVISETPATTTDGVVTPAGLRAVDNRGYSFPLPAGAMWEPSWLLSEACRRFGREGVMVVPHDWTAPGWRTMIIDAGWQIGAGGDGTWTTFRRAAHPTIHVLRQDMLPVRQGHDLIWRDLPPLDMACRLAEWHQISGAAYRATPGVTGIHILRLLTSHKKPPTWLDGPIRVDGGRVLRGQGDLMWSTDQATYADLLAQADPSGPWLHGFDLVAQYLSACTTVRLPWESLTRTPDALYDPKAAGFWRVPVGTIDHVIVRRLLAPTYPPLLDESRIEPGDDTIWLSTPVMEYLDKAWGVHPEVLEAYLPRGKSTVLLKNWAEHMAEVRTRTRGTALYPTAKRAVNEAIGLMGREGGRCYRPDWRELIIDQARVNLIRKVDAVEERTGVRPISVRIDAVWWPSDNPDPAGTASKLGITLGTGLGMWTHTGTRTLGEWDGGVL